MSLVSYKGDPKLKKMFVAEIERHRKLDMIVQGTYGKENGTWKGCAVGCSVHSLNLKLNKKYDTSDHTVYEKELGMPEWLARLEDTLFEGLPETESKKWPGQFAKAVPVGVNLEPVKWQFCAYLMKENIERVLTLDISEDLKKQVVDAIRGVLSVHESAIETGKWDESAARSADSAARSAAWSAARSAESAAYIKHAKYLLKLLKETK